MKTNYVSLPIIPLVLFLATSRSASAQPPQPLGSIFPVNSTTSLDQAAPELATDLDGAFVSVWTSDTQDGSGSGIFAQFFNEDGEEFGPEFQVNDITAGDQTDPAVDMSDDELFAVAWVGPDADGTGIFLRIFDEKGATTMTDIAVNTTTAGQQTRPDVALAEDEQVLVVWQSPDNDGGGVFGRFFDLAGVPLSVELEIPSSTTGDQNLPVTDDVDEDGSFIVAWEGNDAQGRGIFAQRLEDTGTLLGDEIPVNTTTLGDQIRPVIGIRTNDDALEDNGFVIAWQGPDTSGAGVFAQFFSEDGTSSGGEVQVNPDAVGDQTDPDVTIDDEGDFVVTWSDTNATESVATGDTDTVAEGSPILIRGRRFTGNLGFVGAGDETFVVANGVLQSSALAAEANGDFVVVWQDANDGSGSGIFGQRFGVGATIFQDGFESGDTTAWSSTIP